MDGQLEDRDLQPAAENTADGTDTRPSLLGRVFTRRDARRHERLQQQRNQRLAEKVEKILAGSGLSQSDYSVGGGRSYHFPQVVSVDEGPPVSLTVRLLQGQTPDEVAVHAPAIAYDLGVSDVRVDPIGPLLIRLELLP
ncbi:MAG: hypothetical protein ACRDSH_02775 [Pseudonocardiaceae bacterium]